MWDISSLTKISEISTLQGHNDAVLGLSFSFDGGLLISTSSDGTIRFWDVKDVNKQWKCIGQLDEPCAGKLAPCRFHPTDNQFVSLGENQQSATVWQIDREILSAPQSFKYKSAKVVLLGDSGAGKTALSRALSGMSYLPTESTHGRQVLRMYYEKENDEIREVLLWDFAGQLLYRQLHSLSLSHASIALLVYDPRSDVDPLEGVRYWRLVLSKLNPKLNKTTIALVATRSDHMTISPTAFLISISYL